MINRGMGGFQAMVMEIKHLLEPNDSQRHHWGQHYWGRHHCLLS